MIVIPMAGLSQRFRDAGYDRPKYMLDLQGRSVFAHAVSSFERYFDTERFLFIVRDEAGTPDFVAREADALGIDRREIHVLPGPTRGQADTVAQGLARSEAGPDEPLTIFNIDTFRPGFRQPDEPWSATAAGWLEVMHGDDPGFSYALPDPAQADQRVAATAEKRVISNLASTGLYGFARARLFTEAFAAERGRVTDAELYIAPLYTRLIAEGLAVHYRLVPAETVIFCGTPAQYEALQAQGRGVDQT